MKSKDKKRQKHGFQKGIAPNPDGKNGFSSGLQPYTKRAEHYLNTLKPSEIILIAGDPIKLDKYTSWDAIVLKRLAACLNSPRAEERLEVESLLNRKEGKPVERKDVRVIKSIGDLTDEELAALAASGD